jgi:hypothetical protein
MDQGEVNELIQQKVDDIDDSARRQFIQELLKFEQSKLDLDQPQYKDKYTHLIEEYAPENE